MGLGLSCAIAFMISQGMKNVFGKPRPNLLGRCDPDTANVAQNVVSGNNYASEFNPAWVLVGPTICRNPDTGVVMEGFRSFPSAHAACKSSRYFLFVDIAESDQSRGQDFSTSRSSLHPNSLSRYHLHQHVR